MPETKDVRLLLVLYAPLPVGIVLLLVGTTTLDGFAKGVCQGAGIALVVLGARFLFMSRNRRRTADDADDGMWLPSRDGVRR